jgi:hypothetical protein
MGYNIDEYVLISNVDEKEIAQIVEFDGNGKVVVCWCLNKSFSILDNMEEFKKHYVNTQNKLLLIVNNKKGLFEKWEDKY